MDAEKSKVMRKVATFLEKTYGSLLDRAFAYNTFLCVLRDRMVDIWKARGEVDANVDRVIADITKYRTTHDKSCRIALELRNDGSDKTHTNMNWEWGHHCQNDTKQFGST